MEQRRLFKAIDTLASKKFDTENELLYEVLNQLVKSHENNINGGRIWKLNSANKTYVLLHQMGKVQRIKKNFELTFKDNPVLSHISKYRTILANETNETLLKKGIFKYSASGIGSKIKVGEESYYEYMLSLNSDDLVEDLRYVLNIVATVLTSKIRERRIN